MKQQEIKLACLIKVYVWTINVRFECRECIFCKGGRCTFEEE